MTHPQQSVTAVLRACTLECGSYRLVGGRAEDAGEVWSSIEQIKKQTMKIDLPAVPTAAFTRRSVAAVLS